MMTASHELDHVRPKVERIIAQLERAGLPSMAAYEKLGSTIGKSERWVRKIIGRDPTAGVRLRDAWNIDAAYERLCARIEGAAEAIETNTTTRREERHAARAGAVAIGSRDPELVSRVDGEGRQ